MPHWGESVADHGWEGSDLDGDLIRMWSTSRLSGTAVVDAPLMLARVMNDP